MPKGIPKPGVNRGWFRKTEMKETAVLINVNI